MRIVMLLGLSDCFHVTVPLHLFGFCATLPASAFPVVRIAVRLRFSMHFVDGVGLEPTLILLLLARCTFYGSLPSMSYPDD